MFSSVHFAAHSQFILPPCLLSLLGAASTMALSVTEAEASTSEALWKSFFTWGTSLERGTVGALVATLVVLYFFAQARERKSLPPGPRPWPVVGNLPLLAFGGLPHRTLEKLASKYGGIMYLRLGSRPFVVISTAAAAKEMFRQSNDANFSSRQKGFFTEIISDKYRTPVHAPYGPYWRQLRKLSRSELFSPKRHASYQGAREEELRTMLKLLTEESSKGEAINLKSWLYELSANVMTRMLFNKSGNACQEETKELEQLFETFVKVSMSATISDLIPSLGFLNILQGKTKVYKDLRDNVLKVVARMIELENHREYAKQRDSDDQEQTYVLDFVDVLLSKPLDSGKPLPDTIIALTIMELLVAGTGTASTTVEWAMAELMANTDVMKQAREELDEVVGGDRLMQEADIPKLPFLEAVVKEAFRLHPPTPLSPIRASSQAAEVMGYTIPAESSVTLNLRAMHRDPAVYDTPEEFNPQRFVDRPEVNHLSGSDFHELLPFGVGRRMCPAVTLGNTMVFLMLGNLIHSYNWSLPKDESFESFRRGNLGEIFGLTVGREEPLLLVARPRDHVVSC